MSTRSRIRAAAAEALGTGLLVAIVVGSGVAASRLSDDVGVQLLANSLATAFGLTVLILVFGPVSGAHFNPVVTLVDAVRGGRGRDAGAFVGAQLVGGVGGAVLANLMFEVPTAFSTTGRGGWGVLLAEVVATAGLVLVAFALTPRGAIVAPAVGAYIGAAYWFTSSTSFANPAVTVGRMFTDTFAGISPASVLPFVAAQLVGAAIGLGLVRAFVPRRQA
ncbi:aquaporin [Microbacterium dauci]|uniref:MIP/aquaporin family protein n=1 Tax=Microbacterium dauci TaxID=3048008 RepID=A0ABT6ZF03_9MICO|nr:MIP/aquaporin family protein [Microbacterium sp. LX3-4]MDJ1114746.1 MIP/aquaporin family protein [Microbacterium sp. LX3-4]